MAAVTSPESEDWLAFSERIAGDAAVLNMAMPIAARSAPGIVIANGSAGTGEPPIGMK